MDSGLLCTRCSKSVLGVDSRTRQQRGVYAMDKHVKKSEFPESSSRRTFLGAGSAAIAAAAFSGLAEGQMTQQGSAWSGILKGKVAVVTGAARGIGRSAAVALAQSGADVAGIDICATVDPRSGVTPATKADLDETGKLVREAGGRW